mmetsp:Transcript_83609/g.270206  ORF Transcript_83609/g.270206 Transcript_83609/m.270206 type:complete len:420 (-) Transcript_83609:53-1312(-)
MASLASDAQAPAKRPRVQGGLDFLAAASSLPPLELALLAILRAEPAVVAKAAAAAAAAAASGGGFSSADSSAPRDGRAADSAAVLRELAVRLELCRTEVEGRLAQALDEARPRPSLLEVGAAAFRAGSGELAGRCLLWLGPADLVEVRSLSCQWRHWAEEDHLWMPHSLRRWPGTDALVAAAVANDAESAGRSSPSALSSAAHLAARGIVRSSLGRFASVYLRRCRLERNKVYNTMLLEPGDPFGDLSNFAVLVELTFGDRVALAEVRPLTMAPGSGGLQVPLDGPLDGLPVAPAQRPVCLSLTVLRRLDGRLMRVCHKAELSSRWTGEDDEVVFGSEAHVPFRMGGDASDCLTHPALWSVVNEPLCHHVALVGVEWDQGDCIRSIAGIFIGLWDPRDFMDTGSAASVLTVWQEVAEWV